MNNLKIEKTCRLSETCPGDLFVWPLITMGEIPYLFVWPMITMGEIPYLNYVIAKTNNIVTYIGGASKSLINVNISGNNRKLFTVKVIDVRV